MNKNKVKSTNITHLIIVLLGFTDIFFTSVIVASFGYIFTKFTQESPG